MLSEVMVIQELVKIDLDSELSDTTVIFMVQYLS